MSRGAVSPNGDEPRAARLPNIPGLGGAIAGLGGGLAMMFVAALLSASLGEDIWQEARQIAEPFYGPAALAPAGLSSAVVVGTIVHFLASAAFGAIFGVGSRRILRLPSDYGVQVLAGLIYGLLIWVLAYFIVLPILNPSLLGTYAPSFIIQHLAYGVVTGLLYSQLRPAPYAQSRNERQLVAMPK